MQEVVEMLQSAGRAQRRGERVQGVIRFRHGPWELDDPQFLAHTRLLMHGLGRAMHDEHSMQQSGSK